MGLSAPQTLVQRSYAAATRCIDYNRAYVVASKAWALVETPRYHGSQVGECDDACTCLTSLTGLSVRSCKRAR
jgi:hypothetical protein